MGPNLKGARCLGVLADEPKRITVGVRSGMTSCSHTGGVCRQGFRDFAPGKRVCGPSRLLDVKPPQTWPALWVPANFFRFAKPETPPAGVAVNSIGAVGMDGWGCSHKVTERSEICPGRCESD